MEVFFDYTCPFCKRGHDMLNDIAATTKLMEGVTIDWKPCEAHPRPETFGKHSDLCNQGMLFVRDNAPDKLEQYHHLMYAAAMAGVVDIEDAGALAEVAAEIVDKKAFLDALVGSLYVKEQAELNDYAYDVSGVWAVPAYRMNGKSLDSVEGVGVTKYQLREFLNYNK